MLFIKNNAYSIVILGKTVFEKIIFPIVSNTRPLRTLIAALFLFSGFLGWTQTDCLLGVGGQNDATITQVFQLNEEQQEKLKNWSAELKIRNDLLKDQADYLLKKHEESSPEVLMEFSKKYKGLLDSMKSNVRMVDKRLLAIFNKKQYGLYMKLCDQLSLRPMHVEQPENEN